jgi:hypothetical protein
MTNNMDEVRQIQHLGNAELSVSAVTMLVGTAI